MPSNKRAGVVYAVERACSGIYIGETGNTLEHTFKEHMDKLTSYKNGKTILNNGSSPTAQRGRPILNARATMEKAIPASAVVEHAARCDQPLQPKVLCYENNIRLRRIKEALYIRHNMTHNHDQGAEISELWAKIVTH
ncbi:hypothetical protein M514_28526 [Trichuris suis]|uniref:GIY-YIG domain-containing protein n=1 Tax=Trichuris suis TaxID=68888 RepID=A0A085MPZ9_9BILA|nr:hypothetical protein M514_28526 [Trichuris suis]